MAKMETVQFDLIKELKLIKECFSENLDMGQKRRCVIDSAIEILIAYEDVGLSPKEVEELIENNPAGAETILLRKEVAKVSREKFKLQKELEAITKRFIKPTHLFR